MKKKVAVKKAVVEAPRHFAQYPAQCFGTIIQATAGLSRVKKAAEIRLRIKDAETTFAGFHTLGASKAVAPATFADGSENPNAGSTMKVISLARCGAIAGIENFGKKDVPKLVGHQIPFTVDLSENPNTLIEEERITSISTGAFCSDEDWENA